MLREYTSYYVVFKVLCVHTVNVNVVLRIGWVHTLYKMHSYTLFYYALHIK